MRHALNNQPVFVIRTGGAAPRGPVCARKSTTTKTRAKTA